MPQASIDVTGMAEPEVPWADVWSNIGANSTLKWGHTGKAGSHRTEVSGFTATRVESKQTLTQGWFWQKLTGKVSPSWLWNADKKHIRISLPFLPLRQTLRNCLAFHQIWYIFRRRMLHLSLFWQLSQKLVAGSVKATEQDVWRNAVATAVYPGLSTNTWQRGRGQVI